MALGMRMAALALGTKDWKMQWSPSGKGPYYFNGKTTLKCVWWSKMHSQWSGLLLECRNKQMSPSDPMMKLLVVAFGGRLEVKSRGESHCQEFLKRSSLVNSFHGNHLIVGTVLSWNCCVGNRIGRAGLGSELNYNGSCHWSAMVGSLV